MKKLMTVLLLLVASVAGAQSDCVATRCETIPIMGVYDNPEWNTDLFLHMDGSGLVFFRFRPIPQTPFTPMKTFFFNVNGPRSVGVYDLIAMLYGDIEFDGALLLDWATNDDPMEVEVLPLLRKNHSFAGLLSSHLIDRGCHFVPAPWSGGSTSISFQVFNPSEQANQTFTINGGEVLVAPRSPIGGEVITEHHGEYVGAFVEICVGIDHAGSGGGINLDQELWILPRFTHGDDRIVTRAW